jgi:hypothetical protein
MNYLLAKTKGRKGGVFKVLSLNKDFFTVPDDLSSNKKYDPKYKLDEDEWYSIPNFSSEDYCIDLLKKKFVSTDYNLLGVADFKTIQYIFSYQADVYFFQKVSPAQLISKRYLSLANTPVLIEDSPLVVIQKFPDAVYDKQSDTLYFKNLSTISSIFPGIDLLYREATQQETENFLKSNFISVAPGYSADRVKQANRKRIAMAMDTLNKLKGKKRFDMLAYISGYCKDLPFDQANSTFTIETEDGLKLLLYGIEERFYTTHVNKERRLANSVTPIK